MGGLGWRCNNGGAGYRDWERKSDNITESYCEPRPSLHFVCSPRGVFIL